MKKNYHLGVNALLIKGVLSTLSVFFLVFGALAQIPTEVNTTHIDNNGSGMITFNVENTNPYAIIITEFRCNSTTAGATTVLYNPTPTNNVTTWTTGPVDAGQNGWVLVGNGTTAGGGGVVPVLVGASLITIPPMTTYQFVISMSSMGYETLTAGAGINTFANGGVNILTGDGISWGGVAIPTTPTNYPRGFVGGITFVPGAPPLPLDAGITEYVTPLLPTCSFSDSVRVVLTNFGSDTLTSANINWSVSGTALPPYAWTGSLAQFEIDTVTLGLTTLATGNSILAFTTMPNGMLEDPAGAINDTATIQNLQPGLSGTYTVGGTTPDYANLTAAVDDLTAFGICGPVVFDIRDGLYNEFLSLPTIASMSAVNSVTFRSENGNPSLVTISNTTAAVANNYVFRLQNANHYHFENLTLENMGVTYGTVIAMTGSSSNSVVGCILNSGTASTATNGAIIFSNTGIDSNNVFMNNTFNGGSYGMYWYGANTTTFEKGNIIEGNTFLNQHYRGIMVYYNDGVKIKNNYFGGTAAYTSRYAVYLYYAVGAPEITGNTITGEGTSGWLYGIYYSQGGGNNANRSKVYNNMITVGWPGATGTLYGIYYTGAGYIQTYNNSVLASTGGASSRALMATGGGGIDVLNNVLANYTAGYAFYVGSAFTVSNSDFNVIYSPAGNAGYFGGNQLTLDDFQNASSFDANSIDYNPNFYSNNDLHVCNDSIGNQGTPLAAITMDIDGHARDAAFPDMGADEFSGLSGSFLGNDVTFCSGDSVQLIAGSPTDTILWSTGATTSSIWVNTPGSYTVSVNSACGTGTDAIVVTASALNYAGYVAATDIEFCAGDSVLLYSTQVADTYTWTGGSTNDSLYVTAPGTYNLSITDACGAGNDALTVIMNDVPDASYSYFTSYLTGAFTNTTPNSSNATYLWDFGDGTTSTLENPIHVFPTSGDYTVTLTVTNDCGSDVSTFVVPVWPIGLEEVAGLGDLSVYPNPSSDIFNVNLDMLKEMNLTFEITNVLGQVVTDKVLGSSNGSITEAIDLSGQSAGVYYLNVIADGKTAINRMLVKK